MTTYTKAIHPHSSLRTELHRYAPRPPPSPPMDEVKCSLPSISKLLGIADAGLPTCAASTHCSSSDSAAVDRVAVRDRERMATSSGEAKSSTVAGSSATKRQETPVPDCDGRPSSSYAKRHVYYTKALPLTPPLGFDQFDNHNYHVHKSSTKPSDALLISNRRIQEVTPPPIESDVCRAPLEQHSMPRSQQFQKLPLQQQQLPPGTPIHGQFNSSTQHTPRVQTNGNTTTCTLTASLCFQQPLPSTYPPAIVPVSFAAASSSVPWQHHHYLSPMHGASYPQNQDRYICPTCSKAFSRPSSLRIHSHSHSGEKPFKCPHLGCGKAFSVRSNMKRHERGCHRFSVNADRPPKR